MNKNTFVPTPPMGWNSYDYYDTTVNEAQVKANAKVLAEKLKPYGWEYVVVDIEWYAHGAGSMRDQFQYIPFAGVEMDEYSRLLPDPERFPSSVNGQGFKPLADYIHSRGYRTEDAAVWTAQNVKTGQRYVALFNLGEREQEISADLTEVFPGITSGRDLWTGEPANIEGQAVSCRLAPHACSVYEFRE